MPTHVAKSLGEIALRVNSIDTMRDFYRDVIGLELMRAGESMVFFRIAEGFQGHTQVLALFDRSLQDGYTAPNGRLSTVDHIAFSIDSSEFENEKQRLLGLGCELTYAYHEWVQWRSLYVVDPEGNTVEIVCHDELKGDNEGS